MGDTINHLDLSEEEPGSRAIVDGLEHFEVEGEILGNKVNVKAVVTAGSALNLALAGCLCAITLFLIGVHGWPAACGFLFPAAYPLCVRRRSAR